MLDVELDLEADLGIDTVKQAELFATVRETYGIERDDALKLRDYPTLAHVIGFVRDRAGLPDAAPTAEPTPPATETAAPAGFPRRVPVAVVRPALDWCDPTGVQLDRVVVMPDEGGVAAALRAELPHTTFLELDRAASPDEVATAIEQWRADGAVDALLWLPALDDEGPLTSLDEAAWVDGLRVRVKLLAAAARALYDDIASGCAVVTATRLGGRFGYDDAGAQGTMGGAVAGFTKALARERTDALVKVVDVETGAAADEVAEALVAEALHDPGAVEVGRAQGLRWTVALDEREAEADPGRSLAGGTFVVTGAAGSIVSAITADLAAASGGTFHLLDLTPEPDRADPDLARFVSDRDGLKLELAARIAEKGDRATPAVVERELARIERSRAALDAIEAVEHAGGTVHWYQVDLTDGAAVQAVMAAVVEESGAVDALVHCAGLEISHFLPDKPQREYDLVFDVKANGWFHLLKGLGDAPLGAAVVFSSIAGRFGNGGQTDYSAANDLLCKSVSSFASQRPATRGIAVDWTAWAGIGMATRGSIPKMMALAGIDMLPPEIGVPVVRHELEAAGRGSEVVVAGALGILLEERHPTGGVSPTIVTAGPMAGVVERGEAGAVVVSTRLDPAVQPFLDHHRIEGTPVLPGVMGIEGFCEAASLLAPDHHVVAVDDVEFLAPFKCYRDEPRLAEIHVRLEGDGNGLAARCALVGRRTLTGQPEQVTTHFTATVRLAPVPVAATTTPLPGEAPDVAVGADDIYRIYFHGPAYQVLEQAWRDGDEVVGRLAGDLGPNHDPATLPLVAHPRLVELCFQTAGVHELGTTGRMALPQRVGRLELFGEGPLAEPVHAVVVPGPDEADALVVDGDGAVRLRLRGYRTIALPGGSDDDLLAPLGRAMGS
jgi:NAD(P)-dependent dehydrogenase (short-subunit alcohol dehydrogenase family)